MDVTVFEQQLYPKSEIQMKNPKFGIGQGKITRLTKLLNYCPPKKALFDYM